MMIPFQETLLHRLADGLLLRDGRDEPLVQRLGRPGRQGGVHLRLLLAPGDLERLVSEEEGLGRCAEVREVLFQVQEVVRECLVGLEEGEELLLGGGMGGVEG